MRKRVILGVVVGWVVSIVAAFAAGSVLGVREEAESGRVVQEMLSGMNALANYRSYADLASHLKGGKLAMAQCTVAVTGSAFVRSLQECLDDRVCSRLVIDQVKADAPELLATPRVLPFRLYQNGERCFPEEGQSK